MSFVEKLEKERNRVYYIRATPDDKLPSWFFLKIDPTKHQAFDRALAGTKVFDLADYGKILHSGYGEQASQELKDKMHKEYGVEYDD